MNPFQKFVAEHKRLFQRGKKLARGGFKKSARVKISPVGQIIGSWRDHDHGAGAAPADSGYERVLLSPGIEFHLHPVKIYADVELPVFQNMNGNQLTAPVLLKLSVSYMF